MASALAMEALPEARAADSTIAPTELVPETAPTQPILLPPTSLPDPLSVPSDFASSTSTASPEINSTTTSAQDQQVEVTMASSASSLYEDSDYSSDDESTYELETCQAKAIRFICPGKASVVDLMRSERATFKRASWVYVQRPVSRPFISPIQPSKRARRSMSSAAMADETFAPSSNDSSPCRSRHRYSLSSETTPTLDDDEGSTSTNSDPCSPDTPRSSFEQDRSDKPRDSLSPERPPIIEIQQKSKKPSMLRLFPRRSISASSALDVDAPKTMPKIPNMILESGSTSADDIFSASARPWLSDVGTLSPQLPPSPALSTEQLPSTASRKWRREAGMSRFLRRRESRIGLNGVR